MNEEQREEIMALEAILPPEDFSYDQDSLEGELSIHPNPLDSDILVRVQSAEASARPASPPTEFRIRFLPTVKIRFKLIKDYPEHEPPEFWFECMWLTEEHRMILERRLTELRREVEGTVVLFLWHQDLADGGFQAIT